MPPPGFRVGAPTAVSPRAIDVLSPATFFVDGPITYSQPFMTRPVQFMGVIWDGFSSPAGLRAGSGLPPCSCRGRCNLPQLIMRGQCRPVNQRTYKLLDGLARFQPGELHKHLLRGSQLDRAAPREGPYMGAQAGLSSVR